MVRILTDEDIRQMNKNFKVKDRRKKKDRRVAINSCIDPAMDRRKHDRRN